MKLAWCLVLLGCALAVNSQADTTCSSQLKNFRTCIETWFINLPPEPMTPSLPQINLADAKEKATKCFTDNRCKTPFRNELQNAEKSKSEENEKDSESLDKLSPREECLKQIGTTVIKPKVHTCVQAKLPGWEWPVAVENDNRPFDPFGEGPTDMIFGSSPSKIPFKTAPPLPGTPGCENEPLSPEVMEHNAEMVAAAVYNEQICPKESRQAVTTCLETLGSTMHGQMCVADTSPMAAMMRKAKMHTAFCENRQTCFDQLTDTCKSDFWDQKWYICRCYRQVSDAMTEDDWIGLQTQFDQCTKGKGGGKDSSEEDSDEDEGSKTGHHKLSDPSGETPCNDRQCTKKLRMAIQEHFCEDVAIQNSCKRDSEGFYRLLRPSHKSRRTRPVVGGRQGPPIPGQGLPLPRQGPSPPLSATPFSATLLSIKK